MTDILDRIDAALAENREVKRQRVAAHVLWLVDNPTQFPWRNRRPNWGRRVPIPPSLGRPLCDVCRFDYAVEYTEGTLVCGFHKACSAS